MYSARQAPKISSILIESTVFSSSILFYYVCCPHPVGIFDALLRLSFHSPPASLICDDSAAHHICSASRLRTDSGKSGTTDWCPGSYAMASLEVPPKEKLGGDSSPFKMRKRGRSEPGRNAYR